MRMVSRFCALRHLFLALFWLSGAIAFNFAPCTRFFTTTVKIPQRNTVEDQVRVFTRRIDSLHSLLWQPCRHKCVPVAASLDGSLEDSSLYPDKTMGDDDSVTPLTSTFFLDFPIEVTDSDCPPGYYHDAMEQSCHKLGPIGTLSQKLETSTTLLRRFYDAISNLFGLLDKQRQGLSRLGVGFGLAYAILSTINGSITLSIAWYLSAKRTGLSPLAPGQWKNLLAAYGTLYAFVQVLKPFRVAAAIAMSRLCKQGLDATQEYYQCSRKTAMALQYGLGWVAWLAMTTVGIGIASLRTRTPIFGW